jgi:NAD(P)-dependent dehydrogenase (short-subunit alcohol dehydrogenase family)
VPLEQAAVVITGASSGIGRAAALRIARRGGSLALCGRSSEPLLDVARRCEAAGATVHAEVLDVSDEAAVEAFAATTVARFGRIDVWVNSAGVIAYGEFLEIPPDVFRQVIDTNLMGQVHGARAALRHFRARGSGVLITMSSVWGRVELTAGRPLHRQQECGPRSRRSPGRSQTRRLCAVPRSGRRRWSTSTTKPIHDPAEIQRNGREISDAKFKAMSLISADAGTHLTKIEILEQLGPTAIVFMNISGADPLGTLRLYGDEVLPRLRV